MNVTQRQTALIVGASRGLGLALVKEFLERDWSVIATQRTPSQELDKLTERFSGTLRIETVDIAYAGEVRLLRDRLDGQQLDLLFINAGIARSIEATPATIDEVDFLSMMLVNSLSPVRAAEILRDLVPRGNVIAIMTSELGSITNAEDGWQCYSASKAALNMLMKKFASRYAEDAYALLLIAPGWVRTEMGGNEATLSIEESIPLVVDTINANLGLPGLRYLDRFNRIIPW
ncbi:short-chain dehydrogenase/reductase SDR [Gluconobacter thailandicus F149-1 = NBRC 100600]|uniref:Short-chain dehydrogenase/reductase SDR n=1 Tax=Gluconobacter thailandicus NBRC 3257 TaxID=1381097 RepID=A0ABQ0J0V6_GLUTH|nr:short-chain dehydrogenase/reductase SDR [Gluconobacter thailandicus NBRC 3255]GAD28082.1 short-chain dehydrogenase/reductase SDR [Gluconobacter thailandicus NBRC 3257]GAN94629.1 short-chain dehydrogenase/reductase SDR [Gluconobacter thailandicus F149-1 = NBRC 100600]GBR61331.1 dehydrogenase [Gluconobacter thailandicus F149-1 = NBRC 100600]GEL88118.1 short-chain dehydrogenase [Gluconobacter thailandicus F149-1 = NBRC 100600]